MLIDGPHGLPAVVDNRDCVLIAGGSGITPSMSVLRTAAGTGEQRRYLLLYFNRYEDDFSFAGELQDHQRALRSETITVPSQPSERWRDPAPAGSAPGSWTICFRRTGSAGPVGLRPGR